MNAVRELVDVTDGTVIIHLPDHFRARRVEVIVLDADEGLAGDAEAPLHRRRPSQLLAGTRIVGDILLPAVDAEDWDALK